MSKKIFIIILGSISILALILLLQNPKKKESAEKQKPMDLNRHSDAFNASIGLVVQEYLNLKDAFVFGDTIKIKTHTSALIASLDAIDSTELKKDSAVLLETFKMSVMDVKSNAQSLLTQSDLTDMRRDFSSLTTVMYPSFFNSIGYEGPKLYLQECPMAFNDTETANWISNSSEIINPYLGNNHPKYKAGMLHCGELKDSITSKK
jgi:hypothetical protein